jgi:hypothetical protein
MRPGPRLSALDIEEPNVLCVLLDERAPWLDLVAHQHREDAVGLGASSTSTRMSMRRAGSIVVSQSSAESISPRPLKRRPGCPPWRARALRPELVERLAVRVFLPSVIVNGGSADDLGEPSRRPCAGSRRSASEELLRHVDVVRGARRALGHLEPEVFSIRASTSSSS